MKVLLLGSGGREHALAWKIARSPLVDRLYCVPGNAGIAQDAAIEQGDINNPAAMADLATRLGVELTVAGPEAPLVAGVVDEFQQRGLRIVGPTKAAAQLEGSKIFSKQFMRRHAIPTADFVVCENAAQVEANAARFGFPVVLKADGLAAGKGVVVAQDAGEVRATALEMLSGQLVGEAGRRLLIERFLPGEEVSFIVLSDGTAFVPLAPTQDHKAVFDNDQGPNTGGMGAYCDDAILSATMRERVFETVVRPTLEGMRAEGASFRGFLYCGLMMTAEGPQVLEYNVRCGDPETQPLMMRLASDLLPALYATTGEAPADRGQFPALEATRLEWHPGATACVVLASGGYPGKYETGKVISGLEAAGAQPDVKVFHAGTRLTAPLAASLATAPATAGTAFVTAGGRVLGVTARGDSLSRALARAYAAVELIHFDGMHYRRDIGRRGLAKARG